MRSSLLLLVISLVLLSPSVAKAQGFPWQDFERRSLLELIKINQEENAEDLKRHPEHGRMILRGKILPSVVRVTYTGKSRSISKERKKFIEIWSGSYTQDPKYAPLFENEYLFKEGDSEHWLPVQKQVAAYFPKELSAGTIIDIYLIRPGGLKEKGKSEADWLFLVEEFQKPQEQEWPTPNTPLPM